MPLPSNQLRRDIGIWGAIMMGLGSIVGTGVFISIAIAAGIAGPYVIIAIALAAIVAICNGLSSAQLAANYPVSGGTYEYGYRLLPESIGFVAGWTFLFAKSASAATAALGLSGYLIVTLGIDDGAGTVWIAIGVLMSLTMVALTGIQRTNGINITIVAITLISLTVFVGSGTPLMLTNVPQNLSGVLTLKEFSAASLMHATALMFVAYTGYGRIATLGEEVKNPRHTIPRAVIATLAISMLLYLSVAVVAVATVGAGALGDVADRRIASLSVIASGFAVDFWGLKIGGGTIGSLVSIGAITAMLGVLLNLLLGLSRVMLAMARRQDMPHALSNISSRHGVPVSATLAVAAIIAALILAGDIKLTWSLSAFAVLIYYSITNACALRLPVEQRIFPIWTAWVGLTACFTLAFWVPREIWMFGVGFIAVGLVWHRIAIRRR